MGNYGLEIVFWVTICMFVFYWYEENSKYKPAKKRRGKKK
jgi:hypothetical protein